MSDTIDPIVLLRESLLLKQTITLNEQAKELVFLNGFKVPLTVTTAWARKDAKGYYTVGSLWYWMVNNNDSPAEYMKKAGAVGIPVVQFQDRVEITQFFSGAKNSSDQIDERVRGETLLKKSLLKAGKVQTQVNAQESMLKKRDQKFEEKKEKKERKLADFLHEYEKRLAGKTNCQQS